MELSTVWEERWQSLKAIIAKMEKGSPPGKTHAAWLACLKSFGQSQFKFFYEGFRANRLAPSPLYPAEYALRTILDQVAFDIGAIQQSQQTNATLDKAEQLAQLALNLAIDNKLLDASTNVCYFNKSPLVRTIPYAPLAVVGVPFTSTAVSRDFLALPHEIGHHVYQHSPGLIADLRHHLPIQPEWCSRWQEEIFADVFGCLVAGPVIGLDFQDVLLDNDWERFISDDGEHPIDAIRPYIYSKVLDELGYDNAAKALNKRWKAKLATRNSPKTLLLEDGFNAISIKEGRNMAEAFAQDILEFLTSHSVKTKNAWSQDIASGEDILVLYDRFDTWVKQLKPVTVPPLVTKEGKVGVEMDGQLKNQRKIGDTKTWMDAVKNTPSDHLPREIWVPLLASEGWTTNGPEEDPFPP